MRWAQPNILWASLTMALLTLPVVIISVEEAIKTVPQDLRAASLALGATKWQTIRQVVIPNSLTGIMTGGILAVSRGAGEVAPILFTGAAYFLPHLPGAPLRSVHGARVSHLYHVHTIHERGRDPRHPVRHDTGPAAADIPPEFHSHLSPFPRTGTATAHMTTDTTQAPPKISTSNLSVYYGNKPALRNVTLSIPAHRVTAFIGPSGCGKSTFLRTFNRMNDLIENVRIEGNVHIDGVDIYDRGVDVVELRKRVGMIFQRSNPFPKSIYDNVAYGPRINGIRDRARLDEIVESALQRSAIWDEVKDDLQKSALALSGGQQQRLCIARALAVDPAVLLMDEPASALDPIATAKIEELIYELKDRYTIVIVTHNMQQAARVSDHTAFFYLGELVEFDETRKIFTSPAKRQTEEYITGRFG